MCSRDMAWATWKIWGILWGLRSLEWPLCRPFWVFFVGIPRRLCVGSCCCVQWLPRYIRSSLWAVSGFSCAFAMVLSNSGGHNFDHILPFALICNSTGFPLTWKTPGILCYTWNFWHSQFSLKCQEKASECLKYGKTIWQPGLCLRPRWGSLQRYFPHLTFYSKYSVDSFSPLTLWLHSIMFGSYCRPNVFDIWLRTMTENTWKIRKLKTHLFRQT